MLQVLRKWAALVREAVRIWLNGGAFTNAGALAFYTLFSLAPTAIIAVSIAGMILGGDVARGELIKSLQEIVGGDAAALVNQAIEKAGLHKSGILPTVLGGCAMAVGATTVFAQMQRSLNELWNVGSRPGRNSIFVFLKGRLTSLTIVLAIGFVLIVSLLSGVALRVMISYMSGWISSLSGLLEIAELLISWGVMTLLFATIFKVMPDVVLRWKDVIPGAFLTALLFSIGRHGIAQYLAYTAPASAYGVAGSVVVLLIWVYYSSLILFFGAAFTQAYLLGHGGKIIPGRIAVRLHQEIVEENN